MLILVPYLRSVKSAKRFESVQLQKQYYDIVVNTDQFERLSGKGHHAYMHDHDIPYLI